jgi:hypothetical protein
MLILSSSHSNKFKVNSMNISVTYDFRVSLKGYDMPKWITRRVRCGYRWELLTIPVECSTGFILLISIFCVELCSGFVPPEGISLVILVVGGRCAYSRTFGI